MRSSSRTCAVTLILTAVVSLGCGKKDDEKKPATQVAAKVDAEEITLHQVNSVLARTPNLAPEVADRDKREVLDRLIDQQLAKQQAIAKKLDRTPAVQQALEAAKTEILARAYLEQVSAAQPAPSGDEVRKYYAEHPELFAQRRIFNLEEISIPAKDDVAGLRELAGEGPFDAGNRRLADVAQDRILGQSRGARCRTAPA